MELLTWTSEISWCTEHIGPLNMYKHITHWAARPCPRPVSPTHDSSRPTQIEEPLPWADSRAWKRPRRSGGSLYSAPEPPAGEPCDEPVCPAAFTVVWLTLGLLVVVVVVGRHWPPRAAVGGNSCSDECIPLTGQRPFYNLISRSITLIFFFFFPPFAFLLSSSVPLRKSQSGSKHFVMFRIVDGAQAGFAFFAVTFQDLCDHWCKGPTLAGVFPSRDCVKWRRGWKSELEKHCREWFLSGGGAGLYA